MKKLIIAVVLLTSFRAMAQDTTMVEQYCRLESTGRLFSNKVTIEVDFGDSRRVFGDYRLRDEETGKLKKFNSITDALNYMGSQGWSLVNAFPVMSGGNTTTSSYHYYFKKLFRKGSVD